MGLLDTFELGYATAADGARIAYGVRPSPGPDILWVDPTYSFETVIESGGAAVWWDTLAELGRVIAVDLRGIGRSDPLPPGYSLEQRMGDAVVALDAIGSRRAVVCGVMTGGGLALLLASLYPDRVSSVVAAEAFARFLSAEDYPFGMDPAQLAARAVLLDQWGTGAFTLQGLTNVPVSEPALLRFAGRLERNSASPAAARAGFDLNCGLDLRDRLGSIEVPVLVLNHRGRGEDWSWQGAPADLARRLPKARLVDVGPGLDQVDFDVRRELTAFIGGPQGHDWQPRTLATVLVTDIVGSTSRAAGMGDVIWRTVLDEHDRMVADQVGRAGGRVVKFTGDGAIALLPLPSRALHCAQEITSGLRQSAVDVRAGLHLGEVDLRGDDVSGLAVNLAARVAARAEAGEILVTGGLAGAVLGGRFVFTSAGVHQLKGIPGEWGLFRIAG